MSKIQLNFSVLFAAYLSLIAPAYSEVYLYGIPEKILTEIEVSAPYKEASWAALMGAKESAGVFSKEYVATEDGNAFYLALNKDDSWLKNEFLISVKHLLDPATRQSFFCSYPARSFWVANNFTINLTDLNLLECPGLAEWTSRFINYELSLAFASSDYSQPASIFGHTFIALHLGENEYLDGYAINYAANFEDQSNSINYFFNGLTGAYPGIITVSPLHKKIKEYTVENHRNIYFFHLKLNKQQKKQIIYALWERKKAKFDYLFVSENCSYSILKLLQALDPTIQMPQGLFGQVVPFETVRSVENAKLIDSSSVIYASSKKIEDHLHQFSRGEKNALMALMDQRITFEQWLKKPGKINRLATLQYLNLRIQRDDIDRVYARKIRNLLTQETLSNTNKADLFPTIQTTPNYKDLFRSHLPNRSSIALKDSNRTGSHLDLSLRWAYHDLLDPTSSLLNSTSIEAFSGTFRVQEGDTRLEKLDIISVKSLPNYSYLFPRVSKNFNISLNRSNLTDEKLGTNLTWGRGLSNHTKSGDIFYSLVNFELLYSSNISTTLGFSSELGFNSNLSNNLRLLIKVNRKWYPDVDHTETLLYTGVNFMLNERTTITGEFRNKDNTLSSEATVGIRLNYFF